MSVYNSNALQGTYNEGVTQLDRREKEMEGRWEGGKERKGPDTLVDFQ